MTLGDAADDLARAIEALRAGEVIGVPTDTVYGIAADPFSRQGVARLSAAKGRSAEKPMQILAAGVEAARRVGILEGRAAEAAARFWPGGLTLIVPRVAGLPGWVGDPVRDTVGLRVPDHPLALALLAEAGVLAATSANLAGEAPAADAAGARMALGDSVAVYLPGSGGGGEASTVVDLTRAEPRVLREGPVVWPRG